MRMSDVSDFPWPSSPAGFKKAALEGFSMLNQIGIICMSAMAIAMKVDQKKFLEGRR
jgi:isopenicillin N synthase-like dioxygenase